MPYVEESIDLNHDPHTVFDFVTRAENLPKWDAATVEAEQLGDGAPSLGTRTRGFSKIVGRRIDWVTEITAFEPDRLATYTAVEGSLGFAATSTLEPLGSGCRYTYRVEADPGLSGVFGKMADSMVTSALSRVVASNLKRLAVLLDESMAAR